jgi:signal transduction histidine kinase/CheY-like chemotaxis protein
MERVVAAFQRCVECGESYDLECRFTTAGNRKLWIRTIGRAVVKSGRVVKVIGNIQDITERKRAAEERDKLQADLLLAQKLESVGRLAGGVAHDFNNMLGVILGYTEMALQALSPGQALYADLVEIHKAARRSADLTRQLLAFARKQTITTKVLDLNEIVSGMLKMLMRLIGEDIELVWVPGKPLWSVKLDPSQIDQMLANLCLNARDAIVDVGKVIIETRNVTLDDGYCANHSGLLPGDYVLLSVSDSGCGMDQETLAHIYEPFFTTKEVGKGTGLGLSTVYGIVKQNNGYIMAESVPGTGSNFKIFLPRHSEPAEPRPDQETGRRLLRGHETVLLVEDEASILKMTSKMLEGLDYQVLAAATPTEAIRLAQSYPEPIHLLLTDLVMPDMNGRDLAQNVISFRPDIKCLFMSGYKADVISNQEVSYDAARYIQKPFTIKELADKVRQVLI